MKTLYILRHAKSSWDDASLADFDRPLNTRGRDAAPFMGQLMKEKGFKPALIVSSPATRARMTAELLAGVANADAELRFDDRIYEASPNTLRAVVSEFDDSFQSAMLVGHNPGIEGFIRLLTGQAVSMPTAALGVVRFSIDSWSSIAIDCCELVDVYRPKEEKAKPT